MPRYIPPDTEADRQLVTSFLARLHGKSAGAGPDDVGRIMARQRHLETLHQPLPISAQRFARLSAEVRDSRGDGQFLLVVDCGETGIKATRFVRRFATLEELQEAKRQIDAERCGPGCWRNHLLYQLAPMQDG